jgi:hypothetical protein
MTRAASRSARSARRNAFRVKTDAASGAWVLVEQRRGLVAEANDFGSPTECMGELELTWA